MDSIPNIISWAKICQSLSRVDILTSAYFNGGKVDERHPELLRIERITLEHLYNQNSSDSRLPLIGDYVLSLCGKYLNKAKAKTQSQTMVASRGTAYYNGFQTNALPTESNILSWTLKSSIQSDSTAIADYRSFVGTPTYLFLAVPKTLPQYTKYYFSIDDNGTIGVNTPWANGVVVGQFMVYVTNYKTETSNALIQFQP